MSPELLKSLVYQEVLDQHPKPHHPEDVESLIQPKSLTLPQLPLANVEPSPVQQKGSVQPPKSSVNGVTLGMGEAQQSVLPNQVLLNVDLGVLKTSEHPKGIKPSVIEKRSQLTLQNRLKTKVGKPPTKQGVPPKNNEEIKNISITAKDISSAYIGS